MFYFEETNKASNEILFLLCRAGRSAYWHLPSRPEGRYLSLEGEEEESASFSGQPYFLSDLQGSLLPWHRTFRPPE